jgi:hypothetical protein
MTAREFCYWLQGYFELSGGGALTAEQSQLIQNHLSLAFHHDIDPSTPGNQATMQAIHDGKHLGEISQKPAKNVMRC